MLTIVKDSFIQVLPDSSEHLMYIVELHQFACT